MEDKKKEQSSSLEGERQKEPEQVISGDTSTWLFHAEDIEKEIKIAKEDLTFTFTAPAMDEPEKKEASVDSPKEDLSSFEVQKEIEAKESNPPFEEISEEETETPVTVLEEAMKPKPSLSESNQIKQEKPALLEVTQKTVKTEKVKKSEEVPAVDPTDNTREELLLKRRKRFVFSLSAIVLIIGAIGIMAFYYDNANVFGETTSAESKKVILELDGKKFEANLREMGYDGKDPKTIDEMKLRQWLDGVKKEVDIPAINADAEKLGAQIKPEKAGRHMDVQQVNGWLKDLSSLIDKPRQIPVISVEPTITTADLQSVKKKPLGKGVSTTFSPADRNRTTNIRLSAKAIDNLILMPGEEFSFNKVVGERTAARGYQSAMQLVRGEPQEALGGGICQVSSTLYNSIDKAGLKTVQRVSHSAEVKYVPKGRDATVSWGGPDFRFRNNFDKPILLSADVGTSNIMVRVYTVPGAKKVAQKRQASPSSQTFVQMK